MPRIIDIEGIGEAYATRLLAVNIRTTGALLEAGKTPLGRRQIEEKTGIDHDLILEWVNHADLYRIKGNCSEYSALMERTREDTVPELARRNAENLHSRLVEINGDKRCVRRLPTLKQVQSWIQQAKDLPRIVVY